MIKAQLIEALRKEADLTREKAEAVVEIFFGQMAEAMANGERVEIRGFCAGVRPICGWPFG